MESSVVVSWSFQMGIGAKGTCDLMESSMVSWSIQVGQGSKGTGDLMESSMVVSWWIQMGQGGKGTLGLMESSMVSWSFQMGHGQGLKGPENLDGQPWGVGCFNHRLGSTRLNVLDPMARNLLFKDCFNASVPVIIRKLLKLRDSAEKHVRKGWVTQSNTSKLWPDRRWKMNDSQQETNPKTAWAGEPET